MNCKNEEASLAPQEKKQGLTDYVIGREKQGHKNTFLDSERISEQYT